MKYEDAVALAESEGKTVYQKWCKGCEHEARCEGKIGIPISKETQHTMSDVLYRMVDKSGYPRKRHPKRAVACTSDGELCPYAEHKQWKRKVVCDTK